MISGNRYFGTCSFHLLFLEQLSVPVRTCPVYILFASYVASHSRPPTSSVGLAGQPVRGAHPDPGVMDLDGCWRWRRAALIYAGPGRFPPAFPHTGLP